MTTTSKTEILALLSDPAASDWLKSAALAIECRDVCDTLADLETLTRIAQKRLDELCNSYERSGFRHERY